MSAGWVAGRVRAQALARRRLGPGRTRMLAEAGSLPEAIVVLSTTPYRHGVAEGQSLGAAQHGVAVTLLWHLRVLAGWLPRGGVTALRVAAGWFELANVDGLLQRLEGLEAEEPFTLGALGTAWPRLAGAGDAAELRERLAAGPWGDPEAADPYGVRMFLRLSWACRISALGGRATEWAAGMAAVLVAGERFGAGRDLPSAAVERAAPLLGDGPMEASSLPEMTGALSGDARWALEGLDDPAQLWRAEVRCWNRLEKDGTALLRRSAFGPEPVLGTVAVLAADARRVRSALALAARGGGPLGAYDALA